MVIAMTDRFPGGRLAFDAVGKFCRDKLMKGTLKRIQTGVRHIDTIPTQEKGRLFDETAPSIPHLGG